MLTIYADRLLVRTVLPIYAVVCVSGLSRSFLQPARTALGAEIVPRETYTNAITWRSSLWQFAAVVGPIVRDKQSLAAVLTCRATADTGLLRWDRMMTAQWCLPAAIHRPDKNSTRHQSRYDCIGDSASCWPRFVISYDARNVEPMLVQFKRRSLYDKSNHTQVKCKIK